LRAPVAAEPQHDHPDEVLRDVLSIAKKSGKGLANLLAETGGER
jgi:hypothetical protein